MTDSGQRDSFVEASIHERAVEALRDLLEVTERYRHGDPSLDPEEWYAARDFARIVLKEQG